jgi:hypothetical protein
MAKQLPAKHGAVARKVSVAADLLTELQGQIAAINKSQAVIEFDTSGNILTANDNFLTIARATSTGSSGRSCAVASSIRVNTAGWAKAGGRPGSRPATTPF